MIFERLPSNEGIFYNLIITISIAQSLVFGYYIGDFVHTEESVFILALLYLIVFFIPHSFISFCVADMFFKGERYGGGSDDPYG